jgi:hypothetical protein
MLLVVSQSLDPVTQLRRMDDQVFCAPGGRHATILIRLTASSLNSRVNFRLSMRHLLLHKTPNLVSSEPGAAHTSIQARRTSERPVGWRPAGVQEPLRKLVAIDGAPFLPMASRPSTRIKSVGVNEFEHPRSPCVLVQLPACSPLRRTPHPFVLLRMGDPPHYLFGVSVRPRTRLKHEPSCAILHDGRQSPTSLTKLGPRSPVTRYLVRVQPDMAKQLDNLAEMLRETGFKTSIRHCFHRVPLNWINGAERFRIFYAEVIFKGFD